MRAFKKFSKGFKKVEKFSIGSERSCKTASPSLGREKVLEGNPILFEPPNVFIINVMKDNCRISRYLGSKTDAGCVNTDFAANSSYVSKSLSYNRTPGHI